MGGWVVEAGGVVWGGLRMYLTIPMTSATSEHTMPVNNSR